MRKLLLQKSMLIAKFVYVWSQLPTPRDLVSQLNTLLFKFSWNTTDKVARVPVINKYEHGDLKMIDLDTMILSTRLSCMKMVFSDCGGTWKSYLFHDLERFGGVFFLIVIITFTIIQHSLFFVTTSLEGGSNSEILLKQCMTGAIRTILSQV